MVMKINSENIDNIILYFTTNRSAENIISNVPVLALRIILFNSKRMQITSVV